MLASLALPKDRVDMAAICNDGRERSVTGFVVVIYDPAWQHRGLLSENQPAGAHRQHRAGSFTPTSKSIPVLVTASNRQDNLLLL